METIVHDDVDRFLAEAGPLLFADEARHNLALGIASVLRDALELYPERRFWSVWDGGAVVAAALRTPPQNLVLARPRDRAALAALVDGIDDDPPGLVAALPEADDFAELWRTTRSRTVERARRQGIYALERVQPVPTPTGAARVAGSGDRELLADWWLAFSHEALPHMPANVDLARRAVAHRLTSLDAGVLVWEDGGETVSIAGWGGPTPNGMRIGPVYTPPQLRGAGYATALVAALSQRLLDEGRRFCFLYTDLANPTANAIYVRIGYEWVCESAELHFA